MGNTLDAPNEGDWALPAQEYYFDAYASAGFKNVRVPVTWSLHVSNSPPYAIDATFLNRVEQVVDWALSRGLFVVLNSHHESWLKSGYNDAGNRARFDAIWTQVAQRFSNKSEKLLFEILNEPQDITVNQLDELNVRIINIIRQTNPTRLIVFSGTGYSGVHNLLQIGIPNDSYLIANFHSYDPWSFAGQCNGTWGTDSDIQALTGIYDSAVEWSQTNGIPLTVNEFGAAIYDFNTGQVCDAASRRKYYEVHVELAVARGIAFSGWDDGGSFQIYDRHGNSWSDIKDILIYQQ